MKLKEAVEYFEKLNTTENGKEERIDHTISTIRAALNTNLIKYEYLDFRFRQHKECTYIVTPSTDVDRDMLKSFMSAFVAKEFKDIEEKRRYVSFIAGVINVDIYLLQKVGESK